jgi:hypothetical protein
MTLQNEKFEELLSRQLTAELEPQRGRAVEAFQAQMAAEAAEREAAEREARQVAGGSKNRDSWARREVSGPALWLWAGLPSLMAACLAIALTLHFTSRPTETVPDNGFVTKLPDNPVFTPSSGADVGGVRLVTHDEIRNALPLPPVQVPNPYPLPQPPTSLTGNEKQ